jgi:hypothetical protein
MSWLRATRKDRAALLQQAVECLVQSEQARTLPSAALHVDRAGGTHARSPTRTQRRARTHKRTCAHAGDARTLGRIIRSIPVALAVSAASRETGLRSPVLPFPFNAPHATVQAEAKMRAASIIASSPWEPPTGLRQQGVAIIPPPMLVSRTMTSITLKPPKFGASVKGFAVYGHASRRSSPFPIEPARFRMQCMRLHESHVRTARNAHARVGQCALVTALRSYAKPAGSGVDVSLNNDQYPGTAVVFPKGSLVTISGLLPYETYVAAVATVDASGMLSSVRNHRAVTRVDATAWTTHATDAAAPACCHAAVRRYRLADRRNVGSDPHRRADAAQPDMVAPRRGRAPAGLRCDP